MSNRLNERHASNLKWFSLSQFVLIYLVLTLPVLASFSQKQKITSEPRGVGAQFGNAVAINGNTMVVGARFDSTTASQAGAAFVYVFDGTTWTQQAKLLANDGAAADKFGYSVAISEDTIVIGAFNDDSPLSNAGSAYVFVRTGTTWTQQQKLTASDATADEEFGNAVAVSGNTIFVGEHFADLPSNSEAGAVYIFTRGGTVWTQVQKLIPAGGVILGDHFGESLAVSGNKLAVGSPGADIPFTAAGSVYVFVESGGAYIQQQKLSIADGDNGDSFGFSDAMEGNTLVGGAPQDTPIIAQPAFGAAYVFEFNGATWSQQQKLTASDGASVDRFGYSVAVSNNVVAVGAREDDTVVGGDAGSGYVFMRSGTTWTQEPKIVPNDAFNGDRFGGSVALSFGKLAFGAAEKNLTSPNGQGAVYVFTSNSSVFPDFDGDRKADISIFRPLNGQWWYSQSSDNNVRALTFGASTDLAAPGDYDGSGKTDVGVFRPGTGEWFRLFSTTSTFDSVPFGMAGDLPIPGDFDGDGKSDVSVFRPSTGAWLRLNSSNAQTVSVLLGSAGDIPLIADFDGDGKSDLSYYRPSNGEWGMIKSSTNLFSSLTLGGASQIPVPADYDGDGKTDIAVFNPSNGNWTIQNSSSGTWIVPFGARGDKPVPADYDGDGKADIAVFRPNGGNWFIQRSTQGILIQQFGTSIDQPIPLFFVQQALPVSSVQFSAANYSVTEDPTVVLITVTRSGDLDRAVSVDYATSDGTAKQVTDYSAALGTLNFAAGETTKTFAVSITEDSYVEGTETATLTLRNPSISAVIGAQATATLTIFDDAVELISNPIDVPGTYVNQHYSDFLNREPDAGGLAFWTNEITGCGNNAQCVDVKRINVSAAYFLSIEFQETGYLIYRFYNAALNRSNGLPRYLEFLQDTRGVGRGVVVGATGWVAQLGGKKDTFSSEVGQRPEFATLYPVTLTPAQFVDALYAHAGIVPSAAERQASIDEFNIITGARARVLRRVAENPTLVQREFNRAFVLMQYFGYLRRNPDDAPDNNLSGYNFWLGKLNQFNGNFVNAEMVKAFITSSEYRQRFGP